MPGSGFDDIDGLIVNRIPDYQRFCEILGIDPAVRHDTPGHGRFSGICIDRARPWPSGRRAHGRAGLWQ